MKHAVIIVYDGTTPPAQAIKDATAAIAQYGVISDLDKIAVYVLDEAAILQAITAKAIAGTSEHVEFEKPEHWAAKLIINDFNEALMSKDYDSFNTAISMRLSTEISRRPETNFVKAIKILSTENSETNIGDEFANILDGRIFAIIRRSFYLVCQGRHIVFR